MSYTGADRRDFFISFNSANRDWAEWVASELEAAGYTTYFQHWDFAPGSNFVLEMQKAASQSDRTIAVLSPAYLKALFTQPEWAAALVQDPTGAKRTLVPVRVQECQPEGILAPIVYSDLVGLDEEAARAKLRAAVQGGGRPKPGSVAFPKPVKGAHRRRAFPAAAAPKPASPAPTPKAEPVPAEPPPAQNLSWVWFALALLVVGLLIAFADRLATYWLVDQVYFLALVAVGLAAAGVLFGRLHSHATYRNEGQWGVLELGGPVVVFAMVLVAGMWFARDSRSFVVTVLVRDENGGLPLRGQGRVWLQLGADPRPADIGSNGAAIFLGIPPQVRREARAVTVTLEAEGFELTGSSSVQLAEDSVYLKVRKRDIQLYGVVLDEHSEPITNGSVEFGGRSEPIRNGRFDFLVPGDLVKNETVTVDIRALGYVSQTHQLVPHSQEFRTILTKRATK